MAKGTYFYANGKRKTSTASVRLYPEGEGELTVNGLKIREWADDENMVHTILQPLELLGKKKDVNVVIVTGGGGKQAQAEAIRLGITRAFVKKDPTLREQLKAEGFLTRDSRVKERKKPGLRKARKSPQWSKR